MNETTYQVFFQQIREKTKDRLDSEGAKVVSATLGRHVLAGLRELMTKFPEARLTDRGQMAALPTVSFDQTSAATDPKPTLPIPPEFEPALEAYVLKAIYGSDAEDVKDESLFRFWDRKYRQFVGEE